MYCTFIFASRKLGWENFRDLFLQTFLSSDSSDIILIQVTLLNTVFIWEIEILWDMTTKVLQYNLNVEQQKYFKSPLEGEL